MEYHGIRGGVCMEYAWNMNGIFMGFVVEDVWNILEYMEYACTMYGICMEYVVEHTWNMQGICMEHTWTLVDCHGIAWSILE